MITFLLSHFSSRPTAQFEPLHAHPHPRSTPCCGVGRHLLRRQCSSGTRSSSGGGHESQRPGLAASTTGVVPLRTAWIWSGAAYAIPTRSRIQVAGWVRERGVVVAKGIWKAGSQTWSRPPWPMRSAALTAAEPQNTRPKCNCQVSPSVPIDLHGSVSWGHVNTTNRLAIAIAPICTWTPSLSSHLPREAVCSSRTPVATCGQNTQPCQSRFAHICTRNGQFELQA